VTKIISWIAMLVIGVLVILFAVSNRTEVVLDIWPLPFQLPVPFYAPVLAAAFLGFVGGAIVAWFSAGAVRRRARTASRKANDLEKDLENLKDKIAELDGAKKQKSDA
jgi:uncharacterized integral membrane protein